MIKQIRDSSLLNQILPLFFAFVTGTGFCYFLDMSSADIFSVIFLFLLLPLYQTFLKQDYTKEIKIASGLCGLIFTLSLWLRKLVFYFYSEDPILNKNVSILLGFFLFFTAVTAELYRKIETADWNHQDSDITRNKKIIIFFDSMLIMLLCWLPYFLYLYPGEITADSISELNQAEGNEPLSNHHPIAHTFVIKLLFELGMKLFDGNQNQAIATYSVVQAVLLSAAFSYLILTLYEFGFRRKVIFGVLLLYALLPFHGCYSVTMWKDIWFAGMMITFSVTLWRLLVYYETAPADEKKLPVSTCILLFFSGVGVCLFRSNGLYAYFFFLLFFIFYHIRKKKYKPLVISVLTLAAALIIKGPVYNTLNITPPDTIESLSIPAQHIAAAIKNGAELTEEEYQLLSQVVDVSQIPDRYIGDISDSIKNLVRETDNQEYLEEHKLAFLKLWIDLGLRYPDRYLFAQIEQTYGYFYPDVQYWVFPSEFRADNFEFYKDRQVSDEMAFWIDSYRNLYVSDYYIGMFWSIGFMTWITVFMAGAAFIRKSKKFVLIYLPVIGVILTLLIATPVFAEFRYAYCVFSCVPLLCCIPFLNTAHLKSAYPAQEKAPEPETPVPDSEDKKERKELATNDNSTNNKV